MNTRSKKVGILIAASIFIGSIYITNAQDYYNGGGDSWRKKPANNPPPAEEKNMTDPSGYTSINFGFANPVGSFAYSFGSAYGGYAVPGTGYNFSFSVPINHSMFGLAFMF